MRDKPRPDVDPNPGWSDLRSQEFTANLRVQCPECGQMIEPGDRVRLLNGAHIHADD